MRLSETIKFFLALEIVVEEAKSVTSSYRSFKRGDSHSWNASFEALGKLDIAIKQLESVEKESK